MGFRRIVIAITAFTLFLGAAPNARSAGKPAISKSAPKASPKPSAMPLPVAPEVIPHTIAMFLAELSGDGKKIVNYRATAFGTHFFIEEPAGVTVYAFQGGGYRKSAFMARASLVDALKKHEPLSSSTK